MEFLKECYKKMNLQVIQLLISHQTFEINIKSVNTACFKKSRISSVREREREREKEREREFSSLGTQLAINRLRCKSINSFSLANLYPFKYKISLLLILIYADLVDFIKDNEKSPKQLR